MSALVKRLRDEAKFQNEESNYGAEARLNEAADRIEELENPWVSAKDRMIEAIND